MVMQMLLPLQIYTPGGLTERLNHVKREKCPVNRTRYT